MNREDIIIAFCGYVTTLCGLTAEQVCRLDESAPFPTTPGLYIRVMGSIPVTHGDTVETQTATGWVAQGRQMESGDILVQTVGRAAENWLKNIATGVRMTVGPAQALRDAGVGISTIARSRNITATGVVGMLPLHEQRFSFYAMHNGCVVTEANAPDLAAATKVAMTTNVSRGDGSPPSIADTATTTVDVP